MSGPQSAATEIKFAELKLRLQEISDLKSASALLSWDHATYMPTEGVGARARHSAIVSRMAHEKAVAPELGNLLEELEPYAASLPHESNDASLVRVARRDFKKAIKVPSKYVARVNARTPPCAISRIHASKPMTISNTHSSYYFFMVVVVIGHTTKATARQASTFIIRIFVNDTIAIAVWTSFRAVTVCTSFHACVYLGVEHS